MKKPLLITVVTLVICVSAGVVVWTQAAPSIGEVAATPAYVVINEPTDVLFTARIETPTVIPTGVNLLQIDATGRTLATVGVMRDDGTNGDQVAGDQIFSLRLALRQPVVGETYYRVSAALRGVLQRALSQSIIVHADLLPLPPDPGEAGKATLEGIDSDGDGVRDDVQRYIALSWPSDEPLRNALRQLTLANQDFIGASDASLETVMAIASQRHAALDCLNFITGSAKVAYIHLVELREVLFNTSERRRAYLDADSRLSGVPFPHSNPNDWSNSCN